MQTIRADNIQLEIQFSEITFGEKLKKRVIRRVELFGNFFPRKNKSRIALRKGSANYNEEKPTESKLFASNKIFVAQEQESDFDFALKKLFDDLEDYLLGFK